MLNLTLIIGIFLSVIIWFALGTGLWLIEIFLFNSVNKKNKKRGKK